MTLRQIAIVGGGFSGGMLLVQLIRQARNPLSVALVNSGYPLMLGIAYSTNDDAHLLNVRAGRMSAIPEEPLHFVNWINAQTNSAYANWQQPNLAERFVPRRMYGIYLQEVLESSLKNAPPHIQVSIIDDEVIDLVPDHDGYSVILKKNTAFSAKRIALTTGHAASPALPGLERIPPSEKIFLNPWSNEIANALSPEKEVFIIGAGLTMADTVLSLLHRNHRGTIYALSRHGQLPLVHPVDRVEHKHEQHIIPHPDLLVLYSRVKNRIRSSFEESVWQEPVLEDLRPHTQQLWQSFTVEQKQQFIRHLSSKWSRLRHRLPFEIAEQLNSAITIGQLKLIAGRVKAMKENGDAVTVEYLTSSDGKEHTQVVERVINCSGPETDLERNETPFIQNLLSRGLIRPCAMKLGFDATAEGKLIGLTGSITENMFTMGPGLRGILWESVAVPELRVQARDLATQLLS